MFDNYNSSTHITKINAVTGAILKNHPKSWFERFHLKSPRAEELFREGGYKFNRYSDNKDKIGITILQMVICGDMDVMAELVYTSDYEAHFSETINQNEVTNNE